MRVRAIGSGSSDLNSYRGFDPPVVHLRVSGHEIAEMVEAGRCLAIVFGRSVTVVLDTARAVVPRASVAGRTPVVVARRSACSGMAC